MINIVFKKFIAGVKATALKATCYQQDCDEKGVKLEMISARMRASHTQDPGDKAASLTRRSFALIIIYV